VSSISNDNFFTTPDSDIIDIVRKKSRTAIFVASNCKARSRRNFIVRKLSEFIDVDFYGKCGDKKCDLKSHDCTNLNATHRFYLAFENDLCEDYVTEKLFKVMDEVIIPVVYGGANYSRFLPPKSVSGLFYVMSISKVPVLVHQCQ
jgi:alpha-1,3-fucosyltransferase